MAAIIKAVQRTPKGEIALAYIERESGMMRGVIFTAGDASTLAAQLLDAVADKEDAGMRAEIAALRRDQQQLLTALQEVARKVTCIERSLAPEPHVHLGANITVTTNGDDLATAAKVQAVVSRVLADPAPIYDPLGVERANLIRKEMALDALRLGEALC